VKLNRVDFNDDEEPVTLTVTMTVDEAALLYAYTGRTAPLYVTKAAGSERWGEANDDIASCLSGAFFNRFFDGGANDVLRLNIEQIVEAKRQHLASGSDEQEAQR